MLPAARVGDPHVCPVHGPGQVSGPGCPTVLIGGQTAVRSGDACTCSAGLDPILDGSATVLIGNQPAVRMTERCTHGGTVLSGCPTVLIGNPAVGPDGRATTVPKECRWLLNFGASGAGTATGGKLARLRDEKSVKSQETVHGRAPGETIARDYRKTVVRIRGRDVTIYEPTTGIDPPQWLPSTEQIAEGLATLSDEQLAGVKDVYIVPHAYEPRPDDVANHDKNGVVQYFPRAKEHPQSDVDWVLQHESAHGVWDTENGKNPHFENEWQRAADQDHRSVSKYGDSGIGEDFADFMILYSSVFGTSCEGSARALFPNRMKAMDGLFPKGLPTRNPKGAEGAY